MIENHKECMNFDGNDLTFKSDNIISPQLVIPPRINSQVQPNSSFNSNPLPMYQNNYPGFYGMGGYSSSYNPGYGNTIQNTRFNNPIMESFSSINNVVQTFNAFNTLINTAYGALYTSITTIAGVTDQMSRTKTQLLQILYSVNIFKFIKRFILFLKRIFSGNRPKLEDLTSVFIEIKNNFKSNSSNLINNMLSYLFFLTVICGPIVIYKFIKSLSSTPEQKLWNSQIGKSYAAKVKTDFLTRNPDELTVHQGEIVTIAPPEFQKEVNWYLVSNLKGEQGLIPSSFVSVLGVLNKSKNQEENQ